MYHSMLAERDTVPYIRGRLVVIFTDGCLMCHAVLPVESVLAPLDYSLSSEGSRGQCGEAL